MEDLFSHFQSQLPPLDADSLDLYRQLFQMKVQSILKKYSKFADQKTQHVLVKFHNYWLNTLTKKTREMILLYIIYGMGPPFFAHPLKLLFQTSFLPTNIKTNYDKGFHYFFSLIYL